MALEVRRTEIAAEQLAEMEARAKAKPESEPAAVWRAFDRALTQVLPEPQHALALGTLLGNEFGEVRRIYVGKRWRVIYLASKEKNAAVVLFVGFRKEGDKNDAYRALAKYLKAGEFDAQFEELGIPKPGE